MQTNFESTYKTTIKAPIEKVWDGLTNPEMVKKYFFGSHLETDWRVGSLIYFKGEYEGKAYQDKGIVLDYKPNQKLVFSYLSSWSGLEDSPENYLRVSYEVQSTSDGTQLLISQTNYDQEKVKHSEDNWKAVIDGLKKLVE